MGKGKIGIGLGIFIMGCLLQTSCGNLRLEESELFKEHASLLVTDVFRLFQSTSCPCGMNLFYETFPHNGEMVTYVVDGDTLKHEKMAYLWPTISLLSGVNALYQATSSPEYLAMSENTLVPIVECYLDTLRQPRAFQSYPVTFGRADRYYDDNTWLGLEALNLYGQTGKQEYLDWAGKLWEFLESGQDEVLGGGLYWCEQQKITKNTCSNAPVVVFSARMYKVTGHEKYLEAAQKLYQWVKNTLKDADDGLYVDNIHLDGTMDKAKYAYNSGQMLQAASLLYGITEDETYLVDARQLAEACDRYFFGTYGEGEKTERLLKNGNVWFAAVMLRGYEELYRLDGNPVYIDRYKATLKRLWVEGRDDNGLFSKDRLSEPTPFENDYKYLLSQAALVEMYARLSAIE